MISLAAAVLVKNLELLLQSGHFVKSLGDVELTSVRGLIAILLNAILEISGIVQLDTGVVASILTGVQLHVIGVLDNGIAERSVFMGVQRRVRPSVSSVMLPLAVSKSSFSLGPSLALPLT